MTDREFEFSLIFTVNDSPSLIAAARKRLIEQGVAGDATSAAEILADDDLALAARTLLDPGSVPGCSIVDSICEG